MPFPKRRDRVVFTPGDMDGPGFFPGAEWALVLYIYLKTLLEKNVSSFWPTDVIVKETDAQREEGVSQGHLAS